MALRLMAVELLQYNFCGSNRLRAMKIGTSQCKLFYILNSRYSDPIYGTSVVRVLVLLISFSNDH